MRGEVVEVYPSYHQEAYRVDLCDWFYLDDSDKSEFFARACR